MRILITGGAGYIGSVAAERAEQAGHDVVVLDNMYRGHRAAVGPHSALVEVDLRDRLAVSDCVRRHRPDAVMHFGARTIVPESVVEPAGYFETNVIGTFNLLEAMREHGVEMIVLSSTAAVYGVPETLPVTEETLVNPINPYGHSKLMMERMAEAYRVAYGLRYAALRYFNVAGASEDHGEDHHPETHVIPLALQAASGQRDHFAIYGEDYATTDGTAVRDYVHVLDLIDAHLAALSKLASGASLGPLNLGTKGGFSVREVVAAVEAVTGTRLPLRHDERRAGDPPALVADSARARHLLAWTPTRSTLPEMVGSAWAWMQRHPNGYGT